MSISGHLRRFGVVSSSRLGSSHFNAGLSSALVRLDTPINPTQESQPFLLGGVRFHFSKKANYKVALKTDKEGAKEAKRHPGFAFFPRRPDDVDPPVEPSKLFLVKRIRSLYGCPWWEKLWIKEFRLENRRSIAIIKNTPTNNARLYRIKHLVEITPITVPYGMPDTAENGFLKENGEFVAFHKILPEEFKINIDEADKQVEKFYEYHMDKFTIKCRMHRKWFQRYGMV